MSRLLASVLLAFALGCASRSAPLSSNAADDGGPVTSDGGPAAPDDGPPTGDSGSAAMDAGSAIPPDVPALAIIGPADAPAKPAIDPACPAAAPPASVHFPGPCTILELRSTDTYRTQRRWASGIQVGETSEYWSQDFPSSDSTQFERSIIDWTLTDAGKPRRAVVLNQFIYGNTDGGRRAFVGFTDFSYGPTGLAESSGTSLWGQAPGGTPVRLDYRDTYAGDVLGRVFLANRDQHGWANVTQALDRVFLFTPVPVTDLGHDQSFTLHRNGVVATYQVGVYASWGSTVSVQGFDERGVLVRTVQTVAGRFSGPTTTTWTYNHEGDRLTSVVSNFGDRTDYLYDASGNNVERITNSRVPQRYAAIYDTANNPVCELQTVGGEFAWVRHYDYSCF
jgi:YD repeat-containing protein